MPQILRGRFGWGGLLIACMILASVPTPPPAGAYIIYPLQTLGFMTAESTHILLVRVEKVSLEKGVIIYQKVRDLRGKYPQDTLKHVFNLKGAPAVAGSVFRPEVDDWSYVLHWAAPGKEAVIFIREENNGGNCSCTYIDQCWYASSSTKGDRVWYHTLYTAPDLLRNYYCGSPARLASAVDAMVGNGGGSENVVVPTLQEGSVADLRAAKGKIRGLKVKAAGLVRLDFDLKRDTTASEASEDPQAVEALVKRLKEKDQTVRLQAAKELAHWFGPEVKAALPSLTAALQHDDPATRRAAAAALANHHLDAGSSVSALCEALKDRDPEVAVKASEALFALSEKGKAAIPALRAAMRAEGRRGEAAVAALIGINPHIEAEVPAVAGVLQKRASVGGKYRNLLARIKVPQDLAARQFFRDQAAIVGVSHALPDYRGHTQIPKGYWVYVYPYWYIWGEQSALK